ncbi:hypothetical protein GCM10027403_07470 [Arthrobacter tecti]
MGNDEALTDPHNRWVMAAHYSAEVKDLGLGRALRSYYLLWFPIGFAVLLPLGILLDFLVFPDPPGHASLRPGIYLATLALMIGTMVYQVKRVRTSVNLYEPYVLALLERPQRRSLRRQISGREPMMREQLCVARAGAAQQRVRSAEQLVFLAPLLLLFLGTQQLTTTFWLWTAVVVVLALLIGEGFHLRRFILSGRFLERTASSTRGVLYESR